MIILGVDPGTATTGYAVVKSEKGKQELLDFGAVETSQGQKSERRLLKVFVSLSKLIKKWRVSELANETIFFNTNVKTALAVGEAAGVVKLAAAKLNLPVYEYTPLQVKIALTGYGRAEKSQVGKMVQKEFKLKSVPQPDDAADAVAIALCHCYSRKLREIK